MIDLPLKTTLFAALVTAVVSWPLSEPRAEEELRSRFDLEAVQGILAVQDYHTPQTFSDADREMLIAIAGQASIAIQNARLFEELEMRARHEQALRKITSRVRSATDPESIIRTAVRELGIALGRRAFARLGADEVFVAGATKPDPEGEE